ncbi:hypothetical protein COUCH_11570 [Couchioplanes caeruleus]|uniref:hypothetical protein n=1 Tax=Couchioplanes caeruleus TaxID=56438 RepID=UPI0020BE111B|nr:hypothetical protein [Couchioplanes caeruleus]UQU66860.1 hypothetical protein COUCH_11570 [Couchioplanes caeruleus]
MDHPNHILRFGTDTAGLTATGAKKLRTAVSTVEHRLTLWRPYLTAATTHPLHIAVTTTDSPGSETEPTLSSHLDAEQGTLHVQVPLSVLHEPPSRVAAHIISIIVPALVTHAEHQPHPERPVLWVHSKEWRPPTVDPDPGINLEDVMDGDVLLIARHDGTKTDAEARERTLGDYLCERLENPGIAAIDSTFTTETAVAWTMEML